ncbi:MAG TPA: sulfatase, partial [Cytophagales bacterium]|nr:sulfatase [Cytophagales bacterium]
MSKEFIDHRKHVTRRHFLGKLSLGLGSAALGSLLIPDLFSKSESPLATLGLPHFAPKAK